MKTTMITTATMILPIVLPVDIPLNLVDVRVVSEMLRRFVCEMSCCSVLRRKFSVIVSRNLDFPPTFLRNLHPRRKKYCQPVRCLISP